MSPLGLKYSGFRRNEDGSATAWSIFWLVVFLVLGGLVIDVSNAYRYKSALRATADASALAAIISYTEETKFNEAFDFPDPAPASPTERGQRGGHLLANINMDPTANVNAVVPESEVAMGYWDGTTFTPESDFVTGQIVNAARVTALRTAANSNPLQLLLGDKLAQLGAWDVGASAVASVYVPLDCATKEGIMVGGFLNFASNNLFQGDVCLHGEEGIDFNTNSAWRANSDGEYPLVSYGVPGSLCKGLGNCEVNPPYDNVIPFQDATNPLTLEMIAGAQSYLPDIGQIYSYYQEVINNPANFTTAGTEQNRYIPDALVANPDRDPATEDAQLVSPPSLTDFVFPNGTTTSVVNGVLRITISAADFEDVVEGTIGKGANAITLTGPAFPAGSVIDIDGGSAGTCGNNNGRLAVTGSRPLDGVILNTACKVSFNGTNSFAGSALFTSAIGSQVVNGNAGATVGGGTCADPSGGSVIVAFGDVHFASGFTANNSRVVTMSDIHIAAQSDGMRGGQVLAAGDGHFSSQAAWQGCPNGISGDDLELDYYYRLVL
ncbi:hypothetical protein HMH01_01610 [Halovulum dunhuangense]|uniref:Flp pilus-assembly TadG-like N-terminal domain-containing protein n=1 Tax=Halovulum dunhuangense TaxID=1505036 RepID=A0A849KPY6_9RHOB|nr:pilus assembly protein TadG-related protein [Halovulum dunhuangense]NNU79123.1 hypothetical protein [Halovulum dunhuangense]